MDLTLTLQPSKLGQYFEMQCDKYLVYYSIAEDKYEEFKWNKPKDYEETAAARAGKEWEKILLKRLEEDEENESCKVINLKKDDNQAVTLKNTVEALKSLEETEKPIYLYQACFKATPSFEKEYLSSFDEGASKAILSEHMYPDFIKAEYIRSEGKYRLTIIDAKNAGFLKVGAEIQIAVYVKLLKAIIQDEGIDNCFVNETEGIVWNREKITDKKLVHEFNLKDAFKEVDKFFDEKLVEICNTIDSCCTGSQLQEKLNYRISQKCEYCENFKTCIECCKSKRNVRLMPYITIEAQNRLDELIDEGILVDDTIESVKALLETNPDPLTDGCYYWKNIKNNLEAYEKGLLAFFAGEKERFPKVGSSISFPKSQHFSLILTAQQDVNTGRVYAYAWLLEPCKGGDIWNLGLNSNGWVLIYEGKDECPGKGTYYDSVIAQDETKEEFDRVDRVFVESIYELLRRINEYTDSKKRMLQCYVMDHYERDNIENMLFYMLEYLDPAKDKELIEKVMTILFWLQGERMVTDSGRLPKKCVPNPVTVLTTEISRLYVLSEGVAYNLRGSSVIFNPGYDFKDENSEYIGILTNVLEGESVINAWDEKDKEKKQEILDELAYHLRKRVLVESTIIMAIQKDNRNKLIKLSKWPMPYSMLEAKYPEYPEIARLDFENRYEELLTYNQIRMSRVAGIQNAIDNGTILWIEYTGKGNTYTILNRENYIGREWFTAWLCEDTPENRLQIMLLRDTDHTDKDGYVKIKKVVVKDTDAVTVFYPADFDMDYNFMDDGVNATVDFTPKKKADFKPVAGKKYLFFQVHSDNNTQKTAVGISKLVERQELLDPTKMSGATDIKYDQKTEEVCSRYWSPDGCGFSLSQKKAFIHLMEQKLNILVGPPASGKTDFISRALITIAGYYQTVKNKKLKIMVTAMSHSAIDNVLLKLEKMLWKANPCGIKLYKASRFDDKKAFAGKAVKCYSDKTMAKKLSLDEIQIIGMTCWSAYKMFHDEGTEMHCFDIIVMDEASQVRAMDAFLCLECSDKDTRYLLVGDDNQLPPIILGKYKEDDGKKYIHGSIFHMYLTGLGKDDTDVIHLSDNFRMNGILCKYPSKVIYGPEYKAFNDEIRKQQISLKEKPNEDYLASLLDERYPLVFCKLSGTAKEQNAAEVKLVTSLVHELWNNQINPDSKCPASEEGNFWRDISVGKGKTLEGACGIITPHHEHINRLKTAISADLGIERKDIFIGTVDKLQGKERKTVIVSYGVSESEKIINESEFIFSRNRFNVSITRGKAKTIIILSDAIAESNLSTNTMAANDEVLKNGIEFIHGFLPYMDNQEEGEELVVEEYPYIIGNASLKVWKKRLAED